MGPISLAPQFAKEEDRRLHTSLCREYIRGLAWVMQYYYAGVPSWGWYYPFHYAPLASDLRPATGNWLLWPTPQACGTL